MKSFGSLCIRGVGAAVTMAAVAFCSLNARAEIVFGNLGAAGTGDLDTSSVAQVGSTVASEVGDQYAIAFTTSVNPLYLNLTNVAVGLGDVPIFATAKLSILSDNAGSPTGSLLGSVSQALGPNGIFNFNVGSIGLAPSTTYWVKVEDQNAGDPSSFSWLRNLDDIVPTGLNSSGYTFPSGGAKQNLNGGGWNTLTSGAKLAISVTAVPEPSTVGLAGVGILGVAIMRRRRK